MTPSPVRQQADDHWFRAQGWVWTADKPQVYPDACGRVYRDVIAGQRDTMGQIIEAARMKVREAA
jgi:hypothetical protein